MKTIRNNIFETNSSSSHSISIANGNWLYDEQMLDRSDYNNPTVILTGGEFGWGEEMYNDALNNISFLFLSLALCTFSEYLSAMEKLAFKYLRENIKIDYVKSIYSMKTVLVSSEVDDSRPTLIKKYSNNPIFISILSGKINTIYDLEELL
jgi:hypothetical protein